MKRMRGAGRGALCRWSDFWRGGGTYVIRWWVGFVGGGSAAPLNK